MPHSQSVELKFQLFFEIPDASNYKVMFCCYTYSYIHVYMYKSVQQKLVKKEKKKLLLVGK